MSFSFVTVCRVLGMVGIIINEGAIIINEGAIITTVIYQQKLYPKSGAGGLCGG